MIIDAKKLSAETPLTARFCILGGGVAGITLARELASVTDNIIVLEAGGELYSMDGQEQYRSEQTESPLLTDTRHSRLRMLGGSSNHWENNTSPLDPIDFQQRSWVSDSGWPISFDDLKPHYPAAGVYCGVGNDGYSRDHWVDELKKTDVVSDSPVLRTSFAKASVPPVRFYASFGKELEESKHVRVIKNATVVDLDFDPLNQKIAHVWFESSPGNRQQVSADVFILCFGGIENARMLLLFNEKYDNSLGNQGGIVGRYFMDHPLARATFLYPFNADVFSLYDSIAQSDGKIVRAFFQFREQQLEKHAITNIRMPVSRVNEYYASDGISSHHIMADALSEGSLPEEFGTHLLNILGDLDMVAEAVYRKKFGKRLFDSAEDFAAFEVAAMIEQTPHPDNRIELGEQRDDYGLKRPRIHWTVKADDKERFWRGMDVFANEIGRLELGRVRLLKERSSRVWGSQLSVGHHHMGTTRMADSPNKGVVDRNLKVHGVNNLYVGGSSVFCTGGHVPPTLTIVALAIRLSKHLSKVGKHE